MKYDGSNVCILVPTRDRPEQVQRLLDSIKEQTKQVGRIIIIASGADIQGVIERYQTVLPIDYFYTKLSGQIRQRNIGIRMLDERTPLVACIDDDIVLSRNAIANMVSFWNFAPVETAGVGFTITNGPTPKVSLVQEIFGLDSRKPGRVLQTGMSSAITHLKRNIRTQWLNGGTTVWRREVLLANPHTEIDCRWAIAEDLIFSYPIGKKHPLFVCAGATVEHSELKLDRKQGHWYYKHGRIQTLWLYHFVTSNEDLSFYLFLLSLGVRMGFKMITGLCTLDMRKICNSLGIAAASVIIIGHLLFTDGHTDLRTITDK